MAVKHSIAQAKYDKAHCKTYGLKLNLVTDADVIKKLAEVDSMQGYIKQLIRDDIARTRTDSVPDSVSKNFKGGDTMTSAFYDRIIRERIVDTKQYRYIAKDCTDASEQWIEIRRIQIESLDTIDAIDGWETVKVIR